MTTMRLGQKRNEPVPPNTFPDFDWIRDNEKGLIEKYGEGFVLVFEKQVIGFGDTYQAAVEDAERNLPPGDGEITPVMDTIHHRYPFPMIRPYLTVSLPQDDDQE